MTTIEPGTIEGVTSAGVTSDRVTTDRVTPATRPRSIDEVLAAARSRLARLDASEVADELRDGAILVDIRPQAQRATEGSAPGALVIERNVLEWRLDPTSDASLPEATDHDVRWIILCSQGYTSSLAAAALQELGLHRATDVIGGYEALQRASER